MVAMLHGALKPEELPLRNGTQSDNLKRSSQAMIAFDTELFRTPPRPPKGSIVPPFHV
ncbi:phosphorylase [Anopheles sinensis]|uniref:Phosphorylase n=1 Tax=Anopheles sinensis TaxID=74873 RepID=A0A084W2U1_ANOSI|nr:phosphorylase [Anopheles sinensis]